MIRDESASLSVFCLCFETILLLFGGTLCAWSRVCFSFCALFALRDESASLSGLSLVLGAESDSPSVLCLCFEKSLLLFRGSLCACLGTGFQHNVKLFASTQLGPCIAALPATPIWEPGACACIARVTTVRTRTRPHGQLSRGRHVPDQESSRNALRVS